MKTDEKKNIVLIVEDEVKMLAALSEKFEREGFAVEGAQDGKIGLERALSIKPDIIVLDILMPVKDGLTMLKELRMANEWGKTVPVVILTNLSADNPETIRTVAETEPSYYLVKTDWTINQVVEKVREQLTRHE
ncbi:MAG: response regulator [Candidatus Taylorbacteria bacterium]